MATATYTLPTTPEFIQAASGDAAITYNAIDWRYIVGAAFPSTGRLGLGDSFYIYPRAAGANWSIDVNAGMCVIGNTTNTYANDRYLIINNARTNISIAGFNTAPTATRTHNVYLTLDDKNYLLTGGTTPTTYGSRIIVTEDLGSGAPDPTDCSYFVKLGTVTIGVSQTSIVTGSITNILRRARYGNTPLSLPLSSGFLSATGLSGFSGAAPTYNINGNVIRFAGAVMRTGSANFVAGTTYAVATLPAGYTPAFQRLMPAVGSSGIPARVDVQTNGVVSVLAWGGDSSYVSLDGCSFDLNV